MTKIKNFRITLRAREMARWLKKERGLETTPDLEVALETFIKEGKNWIEPSAVYSTLPRPIAEKTTPIPFPSKAIAASVIVVSVGPGIQQKRTELTDDVNRQDLLSALEHEALAQSLAFAVRLLGDQAKEEDCEMSSVVSVSDASVAALLASLIGVQRIGIPLDATLTELPSYARVSWLLWTPVSRRSSRGATHKPASLPLGQAAVA